jgi:hypothetical protein
MQRYDRWAVLCTVKNLAKEHLKMMWLLSSSIPHTSAGVIQRADRRPWAVA